jgi:hypothetical protein
MAEFGWSISRVGFAHKMMFAIRRSTVKALDASDKTEVRKQAAWNYQLIMSISWQVAEKWAA